MSETQTDAPIVVTDSLASRVRVIAERQGLSPEIALQYLLETALAEDEREFQQTVAALTTSLSAPDLGSQSLVDWRAQSQAWLDSHRRPEAA